MANSVLAGLLFTLIIMFREVDETALTVGVAGILANVYLELADDKAVSVSFSFLAFTL